MADPETAALIRRVQDVLSRHEWDGGYDRNGSHAAGEYVSYREGLRVMMPDWQADSWAGELAVAALLEMGSITPEQAEAWRRNELSNGEEPA